MRRQRTFSQHEGVWRLRWVALVVLLAGAELLYRGNNTFNQILQQITGDTYAARGAVLLPCVMVFEAAALL